MDPLELVMLVAAPQSSFRASHCAPMELAVRPRPILLQYYLSSSMAVAIMGDGALRGSPRPLHKRSQELNPDPVCHNSGVGGGEQGSE
jgi:hypothetical protein